MSARFPLALLGLFLPAFALAAPPVTPDTFQAAHQVALDAGMDVPADLVVQRELSHLTTSAEPFLKRGLARRPQWATLVDDALEEADLPPFLAAVPLVESGYSNWGAPGSDVARSRAPGTIPGRGLWMFIPSTARLYGLRVDDQVDDRLDPERETEAAVALLSDLHDRYGDWGLALAGYNQGHKAVDAAIEAGGSHDVLRLIEGGHLNPYAARVMAGALILENPELVGRKPTARGRR